MPKTKKMIKVKYAGSFNPADINIPQVRILEWIKPNSKVLEFGCAGGRNSRLLKSKGCYVVGIEINEELANSAKEICDEVFIGDISDDKAEFWRNVVMSEYDYILFMDVLEHLPSPERILVKVKDAVMKGDSKIIVGIPNVLVWHVRKEFLLGRFNYGDCGTLDKSHLRFFTYKTARNLIEKVGFKIRKKFVSWHLPVIGKIYSLLLIANVEDIERRIDKKGYNYPMVKPLLRIIQKINELFLIRLMNSLFGISVRIAPGLFGNHFVFLVESTREDN